MPTLSFRIHGSFVQWATDSITIVLATQVASQLPGDGSVITSSKGIIQNATRSLHLVTTDSAALFESHVVDEDGDNIRLSRLELREVVRGICVILSANPRPGPKEGLIEPD